MSNTTQLINITIQTLAGKSQEFTFNNTDIISECISQIINMHSGIDHCTNPTQYQLIYKGTVLNDSYTFNKYHIPNHSKLHISNSPNIFNEYITSPQNIPSGMYMGNRRPRSSSGHELNDTSNKEILLEIRDMIKEIHHSIVGTDMDNKSGISSMFDSCEL